MAYYGPNGVNGGCSGGGVWYYGGMGGGGRYMYGRGAVPGAAGIFGAAASGSGWSQAAASTSVQQGGGNPLWGLEQLRALEAKLRAPLATMFRSETVGAAEAAAEEVLLRLHPTDAAEKRRHEVIAYAKQLIGTYFGCEVFAFGSVPLKTYLPDGDIDITVLTNTALDATFIDNVRRLIKAEQHNPDAPFQVQKIKFVDAEVKLIKCVIGNITVDISFNQVGGVSTLCFLDLVDSEVGMDHLFKRSIMLIKSWCYNECNILGAHHWLLSTYALEILVLHIFNIFHKSINGPLEALYKFLEYYSQFEWDKYGVSLDGPVSLSSLRNSVAEPSAANDELLLAREPLRGSLDRLLRLPSDADQRDAKFRLKHLNIIDPLKSSNNLGRSVNEENFYRIWSAFSYGARVLRQILLLSPEQISAAIYGFFETTLRKYGGGERQDLVTSRSLQSPETELSEDVSGGSDTSNTNEDGSTTPADDSLELPADKEPEVEPAQNSSSSSSIAQCSGGCAAEEGSSSSSPADNANGTDDANQEKLPLLPSFTPTNLLDLSGDVGQHLGCLRLVQYNLEAMFDKLGESVLEASAAGLLNEELFEITASQCLADHIANAAAPPRLLPSSASSTDAQRRNSSPVYSSHSTVDAAQQSGTAIYNAPCVYATEGVPETMHGGVAAYMPDTMVPMSSGMVDGMPFHPAYSESYHDSWFHMPGASMIPRTRGTGTYIPRTYGLYRDYYNPRRHNNRHRQSSHHAQSSGQQRTSGGGESSRSQTPMMMRQNTPPPPQQQQQQIPRAAPRFMARPTWKAMNSQPRGEEGSSSGASSSQPPRLAVPRHGDDAQQGDHLTVAATAAAGESTSSSAAAAGGRSSSPASGSGKTSLPAATAGECSQPAVSAGQSSRPAAAAAAAGESSRPAAAAVSGECSKPAAAVYGECSKTAAAVAGECSKPAAAAAAVKHLRPLEEEKLEFGTLGPLSPTLLTPKFIQDFPPLAPTRRPTASTLKSSWPAEASASTSKSSKPGGPTAAQIRPAESPASSTAQSPRHGPTAAAQTRPLVRQALGSSRRAAGAYRLKDEADFPPLQGGTR